MEFDESCVSSKPFINFMLNTPKSIGALRAIAIGTTSVAAIYSRDLVNLPVAVPPKPEQVAIAEALSDADALIESLEQLIAKKRQIKQGTMQALLTGKQRLPGFDSEWRSVPLGDLISHCSSGATPYRGRSDYYDGTVRWITSGELNYDIIMDTIEHISEEAVRDANLKMHPPGTFLMAITGLEAAGTRGSCGIVGASSTTNQSCMAIYPLPELKTEFLYHYYVLRGNELAFQYCQGTKQQSYTAKIVKLLPIDLPSTTEEQTAIATILTDMDTELAALETRLAKTRQLKRGMMQELLTGRIRLV
jgi:type I restriction enzyme S subunit